MVETIDRHGLRKRFLSKYVAEVDKFYARLSQGTLTSEVALGYEKRFIKYRGKLFSFLKHNDVPWNNNNAENAIRAFGELREIIKGVATEKGLREYLVLLSVCETCKRRGISFLEFLLSGETSIDTFAARRTSHLRGSVREEKRKKGQQPRFLRRSSDGRRNASAAPGETSLHRRDDRNVPERNGERVVSAPKFGSPVEERRESVVLRSGGPALSLPGASGGHAGHESDVNSIKLEDLGSRRRHSIPTFTSHDERHSGAGASVLPGGRNPECTCAINDRCLVRTQDGHRVVIASGVVLAQYTLGDHMAESYAMVNLVDQGLANQTMWRELLAVPHALCDDTSDASRMEDWRRWAGPPVTLVDVREWRARDGSWSRISISKDIPIVRSRGASELVRRPFESSCEVAEAR